MASIFVPPARSGWAKPAIPLAPSEKPSASALPAPPINSFAFTSAAIPLSAAPSASSSLSRPARNRLSRRIDLTPKTCSRPLVEFLASLVRVSPVFCLFLAQSALWRFGSFRSAHQIILQKLVQFLRPDRFCEIPVHPSDQAFLPITLHGVRR